MSEKLRREITRIQEHILNTYSHAPVVPLDLSKLSPTDLKIVLDAEEILTRLEKGINLEELSF
jgi:hypothetical protein